MSIVTFLIKDRTSQPTAETFPDICPFICILLSLFLYFLAFFTLDTEKLSEKKLVLSIVAYVIFHNVFLWYLGREREQQQPWEWQPDQHQVRGRRRRREGEQPLLRGGQGEVPYPLPGGPRHLTLPT